MERLVYTTNEVAEALNLGLNKVYELLYSKQIPCVKVGRKYLIPKHALENWLNKSAGDDN
ncbi:MAG TPA: helix-turn-helix domain-containing protein [Bacillota bacterium]|nr:MAG: Helix-turn-helix domain protein [Firmicutes bacterium ADurb.Bin146]HOR87203.1 helix-turn-helix domain-containing protein [Bacillota bacterium]HPL54834.1 helix-turn-helix domain-containing protein [Bacillota bacterium]